MGRHMKLDRVARALKYCLSLVVANISEIFLTLIVKTSDITNTAIFAEFIDSMGKRLNKLQLPLIQKGTKA